MWTSHVLSDTSSLSCGPHVIQEHKVHFSICVQPFQVKMHNFGYVKPQKTTRLGFAQKILPVTRVKVVCGTHM